jgi:hypothetical protein
MFSSAPQTTLAQRALGAVRVARSFLLLEDDYEVDWEVGQDEPRHAPHPHRAPLRRGSAHRRPGLVPTPVQPCLSPVGNVPPALPWGRPAGRSGAPAVCVRLLSSDLRSCDATKCARQRLAR